MKYLRGIGCFSWVLCLAVGAATAAAKPIASQVSTDTARTAAESLIAYRSSAKLGQFPDWKDAKAGDPTKYFGVDGELVAYCFPVVKNDSELGYVIVSASGSQIPIQEFSCSAPPHKRADLAACRRAAKEAAGNGKELGAPRYLYPVPGLCLTEFPVLEKGEKIGRVLVDAVSGQVVKDIPTLVEQPDRICPGAKAAWSALTDKSKVSLKGTEPEFRYIVNVPMMARRTSPESTAGAILLNYWGIRKPREIPELVAQELAKGISDGGALLPAMQSFAKDRGFSLKAEHRSREATDSATRATFTDARMEADYGRPFLVTFARGSANQEHVSATHVGAGYAGDTLGQWLIIHTGTSPTESPYTGDDRAPWCRPGVVFVNWECAGFLAITKVEISRQSKPDEAKYAN